MSDSASMKLYLDLDKTYSVEPLSVWLGSLDSNRFSDLLAECICDDPSLVNLMRHHVQKAMADDRFAKVRDGSTLAAYLVRSPVPKVLWPPFAKLLDPFAENQLPKYIARREQQEGQRIERIRASYRLKRREPAGRA